MAPLLHRAAINNKTKCRLNLALLISGRKININEVYNLFTSCYIEHPPEFELSDIETKG